MSRPVMSAVAMLALVSISALAGPVAPAPTESLDVPDATFAISGGVIALGVGYEWARGTLTYQGKAIAFWVRGVSVMDLGAGKIAGIGEVFNLKALTDFEGTYAGSTFGSAVSHGASIALFKNKNGVIIKARSAIVGVRFNFSGNGIRIRFTVPPKVEAVPDSAGAHPDES